MLQQEITISNKLGLHARASVKLSQLASEYQSEIWISKSGRRVNAKSVMGVMMLAAGMGSSVVLEAQGEDAQGAVEAIVELFNSKFGEGE